VLGISGFTHKVVVPVPPQESPFLQREWKAEMAENSTTVQILDIRVKRCPTSPEDASPQVCPPRGLRWGGGGALPEGQGKEGGQPPPGLGREVRGLSRQGAKATPAGVQTLQHQQPEVGVCFRMGLLICMRSRKLIQDFGGKWGRGKSSKDLGLPSRCQQTAACRCQWAQVVDPNVIRSLGESGLICEQGCHKHPLPITEYFVECRGLHLIFNLCCTLCALPSGSTCCSS